MSNSLFKKILIRNFKKKSDFFFLPSKQSSIWVRKKAKTIIFFFLFCESLFFSLSKRKQTNKSKIHDFPKEESPR
jgi:hypothetical protein